MALSFNLPKAAHVGHCRSHVAAVLLVFKRRIAQRTKLLHQTSFNLNVDGRSSGRCADRALSPYDSDLLACIERQLAQDIWCLAPVPCLSFPSYGACCGVFFAEFVFQA